MNEHGVKEQPEAQAYAHRKLALLFVCFVGLATPNPHGTPPLTPVDGRGSTI